MPPWTIGREIFHLAILLTRYHSLCELNHGGSQLRALSIVTRGRPRHGIRSEAQRRAEAAGPPETEKERAGSSCANVRVYVTACVCSISGVKDNSLKLCVRAHVHSWWKDVVVVCVRMRVGSARWWECDGKGRAEIIGRKGAPLVAPTASLPEPPSTHR